MYNNYKWICKTNWHAINRGEGRKEGRKFEDERGKISWKILDEKNFDEIAIRYRRIVLEIGWIKSSIRLKTEETVK